MDLDPEVIAAFSVVITALTGLIAAVTALWRVVKRTEELVNNKSDAQMLRTNQLTAALENSGVMVPVDPAIADAERRVADENRGQR